MKSSLEVKLENAVAPTVQLHPENKIRMSGQSVAFCCHVKGNPTPEVEWFKNGNILNKTEFNYNSTIYIPSAAGMEGSYRCRAINEFGSEYSKQATFTVLDPVEDSCNATPAVRNLTLPVGCVQRGTNSKVVDTGYCRDERCIRNGTNFTGNACSDKRYCCRPQRLGNIPVLCAGNMSFSLEKIETCGCAECTVKVAVIQGIVVGGANEEPVKYSQVTVEGLDNTAADGSGRFRVEVPEGMPRAVVTFLDIFQKFESTTKVFTVDAQKNSFYKIRLAEKPQVVEFNSSRPQVLELGQKLKPSFAGVEIEEDSFVLDDGTSYAGQVNARVGFMDPRNASDILMAPGDFSALDEDGEEQLLVSYGMLKLNFEDSNGKPLDVVKPITVVLDPEQIDVTDSNGNETAKLWWLDKKTGRWVQAGELRPEYRSSGNRRKRSNRRFLIAELTEAVPLDTQLNIDDPEIYNYVAVEASERAVVTMVGKRQGSDQFYGYRQGTVGGPGRGRICIPTYRDGEAYLLADKEGKPLNPIQVNSSFPPEVNARIVGFPGYDEGQKAFRYNATVSGSDGPIYALEQVWQSWKSPCREWVNHHTFQFKEKNEDDPKYRFSSEREKKLQSPRYWYGRSASYNENVDVCYLKVLVNGSSPSVVMVKSSTEYRKSDSDPLQQVDYGYSAAITERPETNEGISVVCLEYRCNGLLMNGETEISNKQPTLVTVIPLTASCTFKELNAPLQATQTNCGLSVPAPTGQEKSFCVPNIAGEDVGLYYGKGNVAEARCKAGDSTGTPPPGLTDNGYTLVFECHAS